MFRKFVEHVFFFSRSEIETAYLILTLHYSWQLLTYIKLRDFEVAVDRIVLIVTGKVVNVVIVFLSYNHDQTFTHDIPSDWPVIRRFIHSYTFSTSARHREIELLFSKLSLLKWVFKINFQNPRTRTNCPYNINRQEKRHGIGKSDYSFSKLSLLNEFPTLISNILGQGQTVNKTAIDKKKIQLFNMKRRILMARLM